jgi:predicted RNA-binding protein with PUA-like domain
MAEGYWLIKSEPDVYSYAKLVEDGKTVWDGVRNFMARNNLRAMKKGDLLFFYHSNVGKEIVGVAKVVREAYPDPKAKGEDWSAVDVAPAFPLEKPVTLETIKKDPKLAGFQLISHSRLSVVPVSPAHFERILTMAGTKKP